MKIGRTAGVATAVVALCVAAYLPFVPARFADFRAFYCAGRAVLARADPYREHPLRDCEYRVAAPGVSPLTDRFAIPAPFPGYTLAFYALFALLPFGMAAALWLIVSLSALGAATLLLARTLTMPLPAAAIAIGFPGVVAAIVVGQPTPLVALALGLTAFALVRGMPRAAALAALGTALEPHVAVAVLAALFVGDARTRGTIAVGGGALAAVSIVALGVPLNVEYFRDVLAAHALANVPDLAQYSTAHFAFLAGFDAREARSFGSVWYLAAAATGVAAAVRLRTRLGPAALVYVPVAFEVFGGVHVHAAQLALGIPGLWLAVRDAPRWRPALIAALFFAAIPWFTIGSIVMLVPAVAVMGIAFAVTLQAPRLAVPLAATGAATVLILFLTNFIGGHAFTGSVSLPGNPLADDSWQVATLQREGVSAAGWCAAAKVQTLLGFAALLTVLALQAFRRPKPFDTRRSAQLRKVSSVFADR